MKNRILLSAAMILSFLTSCEESTSYSVDPKLTDVVNAFYDEAADRGVTLQKSNLLVTLKANVQGYSSAGTNADGQKFVVFNSYMYDMLIQSPEGSFMVEAEMYKNLAGVLAGKNLKDYTPGNEENALDAIFE